MDMEREISVRDKQVMELAKTCRPGIWKWETTDRKAATHWVMDDGTGTSGKLCVPDRDVREFYEVYIAAVRTGKPSVVEVKTSPRFNMFFDIDLKIQDADEKTIDNVIRTVLEESAIVVGLPPTELVTQPIFIDHVDPEKGTAPKKFLKKGVHLVWDKVVTSEDAMKHREDLVERMVRSHPEIIWVKAIDASVFADNGLRMPWSRKRGSSGSGGPRRDSHGEMILGEQTETFYYPTGFPEPSVDVLAKCSIRTMV